MPTHSSSYKNNIMKISHYSFQHHLLLFDICTQKICEKFVYKHSGTIECVKN